MVGFYGFIKARREPQRGPAKHYRAALPQPIGVGKGVSWGVGHAPRPLQKSEKYFAGKYHKYHKYHPIKGLGERRKLPQWGPRCSGRKWILCIFQVRKKPS